MVTCKVCGTTHYDGTTVCPDCGAPISSSTLAVASISELYIKECIINSKEKIDKLPLKNSGISFFIYVGIIGVVLAFLTNLIPTYKDVLLNIPEIGKYKLNISVSIISSLLRGVGMCYIFYTLKRALSTTKTPMKNILTINSLLALFMSLLTSSIGGIGIYTISKLSFASYLTMNVLSIVFLLCGLVYYIFSMMVAWKLITTYEGQLKYLGKMFMIFSILGMSFLIMSFLFGVGMFTIVCSFISMIVTIYLYIQLKNIVN